MQSTQPIKERNPWPEVHAKGRTYPGLASSHRDIAFLLNPYSDIRFTSCPQCGAKTRVRKLPLVIHVDPMQLIALNKTCKYCLYCDLLIAHQGEIEEFLAAFFGEQKPEMLGNDYLVVGTEDRKDWLRGMRSPLSIAEALECLHDFAEVLKFEPAPRWVLDPSNVHEKLPGQDSNLQPSG